MKTLYLMRHGHSPSAAEAGVASDDQRPLSDLGREDAARMAGEIVRRGGRPGLILHSPLVRAVQTAAAAAEVLHPAAGSFVMQELDNTLSPEEVASALRERGAGADEVLAVGHQPQVGELTALLIRALHDFKPGAIVAIDMAGGPRLLWASDPVSL